MQSLEVLFFTNIPSPYRITFFNELGKYCNLTVLFERRDASNRDSKWISFSEDKTNFRYVFLKGKKIGGDTAICPAVCNYWKDKRFDIRIVGDYATPTGIISVLFMKMKKIDFCIECDGGFVKEGESRLKELFKKKLINGAAFAYSPGQLTDEYLYHYGLSKDRIIRYHFTSLTKKDIDRASEKRTKRETFKKELGVSNKRMVLFVGQFIPRKGVDLLIETSELLNDNYMFYIIGGIPDNTLIEMIRKKKNNNIRFLDFKQKEELSEYYAATDVFVLPTREDIWGLVIIEAMSYGVPVITTERCVAGVELLSSQEKAIVATNSPAKLAESIDYIFSKHLIDYGRINHSLVQEYSIEQMVKDHLLSFERVLNK